MQVLDVPKHSQQLTFSLSLSGITQLKDSEYRHRHGGSKQLQQVAYTRFQSGMAREHFRDQAAREALIKKLEKPKPKRRKKLLLTPDPAKLPRSLKEKTFTVNKKVVRHKILNFVNQMRGEKQLYFWTISFPEKTTDETCWLLLNKWLTRMRKEKLIREYLWIAERQQNGTAHFHMVVNRRMNVYKANGFMRAAIIHSIDNRELDWLRSAAARYNGVDIAKDRKTRRVVNFAKQKKARSLQNYLTKYLTKNDTPFKSLAWHNSREYSAILTEVRIATTEMNFKKYVPHLSEKVMEGEYYKFYPWKKQPPDLLTEYLGNVNAGIQLKLFGEDSDRDFSELKKTIWSSNEWPFTSSQN
jgi:hypothetical protein